MTAAPLPPAAMPGSVPGAVPAAPRARIPWYWLCQLAGWGLVAGVNISFSIGIAADARYKFMLIALWGGFTGLLLSHGWRHYLRRQHV